jgi:hypothetical protein
MKNLKFFGIVMMLVMGMSFTSCSSDDEPGSEDQNGASSNSIKEYIEGEWFLIEEKEEYDGETEITVWDYDDQTSGGISSDDGYGYGYEPEKLYIRCVEGNVYSVTEKYYSLYYDEWETDDSFVVELDGNIIYEDKGESSGGYYSEKTYIKSVSKNTLVIVNEEKDIYDGEVEIEITTSTYRRNN